MYICNCCGHLVEELKTERLYDDNLYEGYIDETISACPCCSHGELVEATECEICGEWFDNNGLYGVCEVCLHEHETVGMALEKGEKNTKTVDGINGAVAHLLSIEQINKILIKWVEENFVDRSKPIARYLEQDLSNFSEFIIENNKESD